MKRMPRARRTAIEMAIARGWSDDRIARDLNADETEIDAVWLGMEVAITTQTRVGRGSDKRSTSSLAAIAREETARVYSGLVREHHGSAWPLPASEWEQRRLDSAARNLRRGAR